MGRVVGGPMEKRRNKLEGSEKRGVGRVKHELEVAEKKKLARS